MGPREEDNDLLLLVVVSVICVTLVGILDSDRASRPWPRVRAVVASEEPGLVILPFQPNTSPGRR
jgi:hypothetical protein